MSEQNINIQLIDYIKENLTGDTQKNALNFVQHLISIGMTAKGSINDGKFVYKGVTVCNTYFGSSSHNPGYPEPYTIWTTKNADFGKEIESVPFNSRMKEIAWENVETCDPHCPQHSSRTWCQGSATKVIFGRKFDNLCAPVYFTCDPNADAIECAVKLMEMRKYQIDTAE